MNETIQFLKEKTNDFKPEIGLILGSGLGDFVQDFSLFSVSYSEIPGFAPSTVQGHAGKLVFAEIKGKKVVIMQGRYHFYEGHSMQKVVFPVKVMKKLGVETLIVTNAAGSVKKKIKAGDLMLIKDHINFMGTNPLIGLNDDSLGTRFPDMSEVYRKELRTIAKKSAKKLGIKLKEGVYAAFSGPSYETPAEVKMLNKMGADVVGMSTIPEAIVANYCSMNVLGISCVSNYAAGIQKNPLSHSEVIETSGKVQKKFQALLLDIIESV